MLSEAKKRLNQYSYHHVQHSACGDVTAKKGWMGRYHDLSDYVKQPDSLSIYLTDIISPVVRFQLSMVKTFMAFITHKNQSILVATDREASLRLNGLLVHSDSTSFGICK